MSRPTLRRMIAPALSVALLGTLASVRAVRLRGSVLDPPRFTRQELALYTPEHASEFATMAEPMALPRCGDTRPPEALLTPDPLLDRDQDLRVRVSFIVGTDGHVHSPFILDSGGQEQDELVLRAVRHWRYRPALCNGVPTDSEARIRFRIR